MCLQAAELDRFDDDFQRHRAGRGNLLMGGFGGTGRLAADPYGRTGYGGDRDAYGDDYGGRSERRGSSGRRAPRALPASQPAFDLDRDEVEFSRDPRRRY